MADMISKLQMTADRAALSMLADLPADDTTTASVAVGGAFSSVIDAAGDADWIAVELQAGQTVQISVNASGTTPLRNPFAAVYDANGVLLNENSTSGPGRNAEIILTAETAGTYYVEVRDTRGTATGEYTVSVTQTEPPDPVASLDWGGERLDSNTITVYFAPSGATYDGITSEGFNAYEIQQFETAFALIESMIDVTFVVTDDPNADLRLVLDTDGEFGEGLGYFNPPGTRNEGVGVFNGAAWDREPGGSLEVGGFDFVTIVHELLHGLGLAHPHDTGGGSPVMANVESPFDDYGDFDLNQGVYTTMSYNSGNPAGTPGDRGLEFGYEGGPMALDIAILQDKYGANTTTAAGNDMYMLPDANAGGTYWVSIWDVGGTDTIAYAGTQDVVIDLRAATLQHEAGGGGFLSQAQGIAGGYTIANGVVIENATGGAGDDSLTGNDAGNMLNGQAGTDWLIGAAGEDVLIGGADRDILNGGEDDDTFVFAVADSGAERGERDIVVNFQDGRDVIDLSMIDADAQTAGNQALEFIGSDGFDGAGIGQVQVAAILGNRSMIGIDMDGDGAADMQIFVNSTVVLAVDDFIF